jgi:hypothetical protein
MIFLTLAQLQPVEQKDPMQLQPVEANWVPKSTLIPCRNNTRFKCQKYLPVPCNFTSALLCAFILYQCLVTCPAGVHKDVLVCEDSAKDKQCANHVTPLCPELLFSSGTKKSTVQVLEHWVTLQGRPL